MAIKFSKQALAIKESHYKTSEHINLTNTLSILGKIESNLGHYNAAKKIFQKALTIKEN